MITQTAETRATDAGRAYCPPREALEDYLALLLRVETLGRRRAEGPLTIALTSCRQGEGVTTIAVNLAVAAACGGRQVLLVDGNYGQPSLHRMLGCRRVPGVAELLSGDIEPLGAPQASPLPALCVVSAGRPGREGLPGFEADGWTDLLAAWKRHFDLVILDLPSVGAAPSLGRLASRVDGVVLVVEAECVRRQVVRRTKEQLERDGARLFGVVLNKQRRYVPRWLYRTL